jgi:23S rRNA G2445 N2-methylase RlmL
VPGLEEIAGQEVEARLAGAWVIETQRGWTAFRYPGPAADLLQLRTTEDVFAVLFRTAELPAYRSGAIPLLARVAQTCRSWDQAMAAFHQTRAHSVRRITFRIIAQMTGQHGFRREEVRDAVLSGVQSRWTGWKPVADDAHIEIWAPIIGSWAAVAVRLSNRSMRHRTYKQEHRPAALRPTLAAAMIALLHPQPTDRFCDPMCGTGTILVERALFGPGKALVGGDIDAAALEAAMVNLSQSGITVLAPERESLGRNQACFLHCWDARSLPLGPNCIDAVACNLPFGEKMGSHADNVQLYDRFFRQLVRVLRPGGRAALLTSEKELVRQCLDRHTQLQREREILVAVLGRAARIYMLRKK